MSQHGGQWRHSRSRNKRLFTMNIPPASLPRLLPVWAGLLLAAFSGILMACAFIPVDWGGCVWIGFLPLLTALWYGRRREGKRGMLAYALYGWMFGVVFYGISFWWVNEVSTLGYIPLMIFYGGLFPGLWALVMGVFFRPDARPLPDARLKAKERRAAWKTWALGDILPSASAALAGAALWVCLEWGRGWLIPGFGWNNLGVALYGNPLAQWAEYLGVTALAFIPAVFSVWLWRVCRRAGTMIIHEGRRTVPWDFFILVAVLLTMFVTGVVWTARYSAQSAEATGDGRFTVPVMAVQLNLSQKEKWDPANRRSIYRALLDMTEQGMLDLQNRALEQAVKDGAEASLDMPAWVIWPESSFPISTFYRDATGERFSNQDNVNFLSAEEDYVQASAGTAMGLNYTPGCSSSPVPVPIRPGSSVTVGVIPLVCFEDVVGSWVRRFIRQEPQLMVNVTNDGWFNRSCANEQHWRNAAFRCIELRRAMVRAANTGVSVALAPNGAVIADLRDSSGSPFTRGVMAATLPVGCTKITLYAMLGDWAVLVCFLVFAALLLRRIGAGKRVHGPVENGVYRRSTGATPR